ncbi:uncharacterized protein LOC111690911 [Lucilia cuprina]|uniref:uncharacterized protein LOC111690911 n=1 Tax=Lucilia cuprina TaxID=7375 RepID=UPI000C71C3B2|nr:uncharacterized protein LOC111690911 [Lucilia cuprina]
MCVYPIKPVLLVEVKRDLKNEQRRVNKDILPIVRIETKPSLAAAMHTNRDLVFIPGQRGRNLLFYQNYTYSKNNGTGNTTYWKCRIVKNGKPCNARITTFLRPNEATAAVYSATSRGRIQLIYGGQPFIFEKKIKLATNEEKKYWRCNQWWNQKCRSRVCTINDMVIPLNRYHTHEEIVRRKKRVRKNIPADKMLVKSETHEGAANAASTTAGSSIDVSSLGMHLKYEEIVADVTEIVEPSPIVITKK